MQQLAFREVGRLGLHHALDLFRVIEHVQIQAGQVHLTHLHVVAALIQRVHPRTARMPEHAQLGCLLRTRLGVNGAKTAHLNNLFRTKSSTGPACVSMAK